MNTDPLIKRLRWGMQLVMVVDLAITLLGQPDSYWTDPRTAAEGNVVVRFFIHQGLAPFALACIAYGPIAVFLVSVLPRRIGLFLLLTTLPNNEPKALSVSPIIFCARRDSHVGGRRRSK